MNIGEKPKTNNFTEVTKSNTLDIMIEEEYPNYRLPE